MPLLARIALAASLIVLSGGAGAHAAPTGEIAAAGNTAVGSGYGYVATVTWDGCPQLCDWKILVEDVPTVADCARSLPFGFPETRAATRATTATPNRSNGPFAANGAQTYVEPVVGLQTPGTYTLCLSAVGLTPTPPPWTPGDPLPPPPVPDPCVEPWFYQAADDVPVAGRCQTKVPLQTVTVVVPELPKAAPIVRPVLAVRPPGPATAARAPRLTRAETTRALRAKRVKGTLRCRALSTVKQRCTATRKDHKRKTYTVVESRGRVRVR